MILLFVLLVYQIWTYRFSAANRGQYGVPKYYLPLIFKRFIPFARVWTSSNISAAAKYINYNTNPRREETTVNGIFFWFTLDVILVSHYK